MGPKNHPESMASGGACGVGIDFAIDSARRSVVAARVMSHEKRFGRLPGKATSDVCKPN